MIKEFSVEALAFWGEGTVDQLHFGHCIIHANWPMRGVSLVSVYRNGASVFEVGRYNKKDANWKLKALVEAFKHYDTDEDRAALAKIITVRMMNEQVTISQNAYLLNNED
jgi:hypothetical protein